MLYVNVLAWNKTPVYLQGKKWYVYKDKSNPFLLYMNAGIVFINKQEMYKKIASRHNAFKTNLVQW